MAIEVKALDEDEFLEAAAGGYVYGKRSLFIGNRYQTLYLYIDNLGEQRPYRGRGESDPNVRRKFFVSGDIYYAKSEAKLDSGNFVNKVPERDSIILYW